MPTIHPTATVDPAVELAPDVEIGPSCVVSGPVKLGPGVRLIGHVYLQGPLSIGAHSIIYPFACIGFEPQDVKFKPGHPTAGVVIGERAILREHVTIHSATRPDRPTRLGDDVFMLVNSHVGHDAQIGSRVTMVNNSAAAGHVEIGDNVLLGGGAVIHQFVRVGRFVVFSGDCAVNLDVPPFCIVSERNRVGSINRIGLRRNGFPREHITALLHAYRDFLRLPMPNTAIVEGLRARGAHCPPVQEMAEFIAASKRGIVGGMGRPPRGYSSLLRALASNADALLAAEDTDEP
jgi:UDP-N-acetylglucosamine acyltransferase